VLREITLGSTPGAERKAGSCRQAVFDGSFSEDIYFSLMKFTYFLKTKSHELDREWENAETFVPVRIKIIPA